MKGEPAAGRKIGIVGVGASAGGLEALREMLAAADPEGGLAYVVIQHLDPNHASLLAELLGRHTALPVVQAVDRERVDGGKVYIIPPGHGLAIRDGVLTLNDFDQPRGLRRPIDDFFESLAEDQGPLAACVILSGTGADGSAGLRAIKEHGGICVVQDPATAKYDGMPASAWNTGLVDVVRRPDEIVDSLRRFYEPILEGRPRQNPPPSVEPHVAEICAVLQESCGHDFSGYKAGTLVRRIQRRMQVLGLIDPRSYLDHLRGTDTECDALFRDLLINVTRFFRDAAHFTALRDRAIRPLVAAGPETIRLWVPGCSSGEEAYSLAMLAAHEVERQRKTVDVQVFATDIDERMLAIARDGQYPGGALADIPEDLREAYTVTQDGHFRVTARIRDMVRFSCHNLVRDPPFLNIDILSCRNLLIYFGTDLQAVALPIFHYALAPGGTLFLGPSETLGKFDTLFAPVEPQARIFRRTQARPHLPVVHRHRPGRTADSLRGAAAGLARTARTEEQEADTAARLLAAYAPPSLRVTPRGEILGSTGRLGRYLDIPPDNRDPAFVQSLARPGAREAISAVIRRASETGRRTVVRDLVAASELGQQPFELVAEPAGDTTLLLIFRERDRFRPLDDADLEELAPSDSHVQGLEEELRATRERLHIAIEELETANEELKSSNEEMMSMNEELTTVNDELTAKVDELSVANADLSNFFASTGVALVVVDDKLRVRNFTAPITEVYHLGPDDRGRPLSVVASRLIDAGHIVEVAAEVIASGEARQLRLRSRARRRTWALAVTPYLARDGRRVGATLLFTELTQAIRLEEALEAEGKRLRLALDVANLGVWEYDPGARRLRIDDTAASLLDATRTELSLVDFVTLVDEEDADRVRDEIRAQGRAGEILDIRFGLAGPTRRRLECVGRRVAGHGRSRFLGVVFDVTAEDEAQRVREMMLREMNHRVKNMFSIISGMLRLAGREATDVGSLVQAVESRISALAASHDMTQEPRSGSRPEVVIGRMVDLALAPFASSSVVGVTGPEIPVGSHEVTALSLVLHELATNSAKYGVLGPVDGRLEVTWSKAPDGKVSLEWNEIYAGGVDPVEETAGFGSTLLRLSAIQLQGEIRTESTEARRRTVLTYESDA